VRFWDTSGLVPLVLEEPGTELAMGWLREDPDVAVWGLTRLEIASAVERAARDGRIPSSIRRQALRRIDRIAGEAHEVSDLPAVRVRAVSLVARHPLRAADAAQLGAALLVADPDPASLGMVVLDRRLAEAAEREGLRVLTWPD
jgi:hypothetical protein